MNYKKLLVLPILTLLASCGGGETSTAPVTSTPTTSEPTSEVTTSEEPSVPTISVDDKELENYKYFDNAYTYNNNNRPGNKEWPDPFVYRYNGMYYLYRTGEGQKIACFQSEDLVNWEPVENGDNSPGYCYEYAGDPGHPRDSYAYAPEVTYVDGTFYMAVSPSGNGHYILESDSPMGPFSAATGNIGLSIDGSYFFDSDEELYFMTASGGQIKMYTTDMDDPTEFVCGDDDNPIAKNLMEASMKAWTEGPYMLQRNGEYYLTYTGNHYLSENYRVDYCYGGADLEKFSSDLEFAGTVLLETTTLESNFCGLGHSCNVLGPDLDSYYIVYHNLLSGANRPMNLSRLNFNGEEMRASSVREGEINNLYAPEYSTYTGYDITNKVGDFNVTQIKHEDTFSVEYNITGNGRMVFSFQDENNYNFIDYVNNSLVIGSVAAGVETTINTVKLIREYSTDVNHTIRLSAKDGKFNLYFDTIEKLALSNGAFVGGSIGFKNISSFEDLGAVTFSNVGLGSSDERAYEEDVKVPSSFVKELSILNKGSGLVEEPEISNTWKNSSYMKLANIGDRATYRVQSYTDEYKNISARIPGQYAGKTIGLKVDNNDVMNVELNGTPVEGNDVEINLGTVHLTEGPHHISIVNVGDEFEFSTLRLLGETIDPEDSYDFTGMTSEELKDEFKTVRVVGGTKAAIEYNFDKNGLDLASSSYLGAVSHSNYIDGEVTMKFELSDTLNSEDNAYVSLLARTTKLTGNPDVDTNCLLDSFVGYRLTLNGKYMKLENVNYYHTKTVKQAKAAIEPGVEYTLSLKLIGNKAICSLNDEEILNLDLKLGNTQGGFGFFTNNVKGHISSLEIA